MHFKEPVVPAGGGDVSGTARGHGRAGRAALRGGQRQGRRELRVLGEEEEEEEIPRPGDAAARPVPAPRPRA